MSTPIPHHDLPAMSVYIQGGALDFTNKVHCTYWPVILPNDYKYYIYSSSFIVFHFVNLLSRIQHQVHCEGILNKCINAPSCKTAGALVFVLLLCLVLKWLLAHWPIQNKQTSRQYGMLQSLWTPTATSNWKWFQWYIQHTSGLTYKWSHEIVIIND